MWEQNETAPLEGESAEYIRPSVMRRCGRPLHDPELALGMMNDGHGVPGGGANGPASTQKIDLVVSVDSTAHVKRQVKIQQAAVGTGAQHDALVGPRLGASLIRGQAGGAADGPILAGQLVREQFLSRGVGRDFLVGQER